MPGEEDYELPLVPFEGKLEFADLPQLGALLHGLQAMKDDRQAPDPNDQLMAELVTLRGKLTALADYHTFVTRPARTGPAPNVCPCCRRPY